MNELTLHLADGTAIVVPASLDAITTYILLEQDAWFEKETAVLDWFRPGMTVIDVGANLGVYSLPMARRVAPDGEVFAYEPASEARGFLGKSRGLNRLDNLHVIPTALSDRPREGHLIFGESSELHRLGEKGVGEDVRITSLDEEDRIRNWRSVDFVKIDAEGEELRIIDGGRTFFARHSPLVMFEFKAAYEINPAIAEGFRAMGYRIFRLLTGAPLLVPAEPGEALDPFELNLFAAKPERAQSLAGEGRLIEASPEEWRPGDLERVHAFDLLEAQAFAPACRAFFAQPIDPAYRDALTGYAQWRSSTVPLPQRYAALLYACRTMHALCQSSPTSARLSTLARFAWEAGQYEISRDALDQVCRRGQRGEGTVNEPFWPANPHFDTISPGAQPGDWFIAGVMEHLERISSYSSAFADSRTNLDWLAGQRFASLEMERRHMLRRLRKGERLPVPARLLVSSPGHINAEVWRDGLVPNTLKP